MPTSDHILYGQDILNNSTDDIQNISYGIIFFSKVSFFPKNKSAVRADRQTEGFFFSCPSEIGSIVPFERNPTPERDEG